MNIRWENRALLFSISTRLSCPRRKQGRPGIQIVPYAKVTHALFEVTDRWKSHELAVSSEVTYLEYSAVDQMSIWFYGLVVCI